MRKQCGKMIKKSGMPEPRPCIRRVCNGMHSPDLTGLRDVFGFRKILAIGPVYTTPSLSNSRTHRWWVLDKFGSKRLVIATELFSGRSTGRNTAVASGLGVYTKDGKMSPEYSTVASHFRKIKAGHPSYKGMPFYRQWDTSLGGSLIDGAMWIRDNLPKRRALDHLHIIDRRIGFMPGNLIWISKHKHKQEELLNKTLLENSRLKKKLARCA